ICRRRPWIREREPAQVRFQQARSHFRYVGTPQAQRIDKEGSPGIPVKGKLRDGFLRDVLATSNAGHDLASGVAMDPSPSLWQAQPEVDQPTDKASGLGLFWHCRIRDTLGSFVAPFGR